MTPYYDSFGPIEIPDDVVVREGMFVCRRCGGNFRTGSLTIVKLHLECCRSGGPPSVEMYREARSVQAAEEEAKRQMLQMLQAQRETAPIRYPILEPKKPKEPVLYEKPVKTARYMNLEDDE